MISDDFEETVRSLPGLIPDEVFRVADTAYLARKWLEQYCEDSYTAADVLQLASMILDLERYNKE